MKIITLLCLLLLADFNFSYADTPFEKIVKERNEAIQKVRAFDHSVPGPRRDLSYFTGTEKGLSTAVEIFQNSKNPFEEILKERDQSIKKVQAYDHGIGGTMRDFAYLLGVEKGLCIAVSILQEANLIEKDKHVEGWKSAW